MANVIQAIFGKEDILAPIPEGCDTSELAAHLGKAMPAWIHVHNTVTRANGDLVIYTEVTLYRAVFSLRFWCAMATEGRKRLKRFLTAGGH